MKHLVRSTLYGGKVRRFNESVNKEELQDFCETYLAYLLDNDDFKIKASIYYVEFENQKGFKWDQIKNFFIPFLVHLNNKYDISTINIFTSKLRWYRVGSNQLINDDLIKGVHPPNKFALDWYKIQIDLK
jgi:hypothetical protein